MLHKILFSKWLPLYSTGFFYVLYYLIGSFKFDVQIRALSIPYDFILQLTLAYLVFALSKRTWLFLAIHGLLMGLLYIGNAIKIAFFGGPIMPDDVFAVRALLLILDGWRFFAFALPVTAVASLLLFNFSMRHWRAYTASMALMLLVVTVVYKPASIVQPLDAYFGNSVWDQRSNYVWRGATLYTLIESARYFYTVDAEPDYDSVQKATENLRLSAVPKTLSGVAPKSFSPRNIHIVLLESFWDPNMLKNAHYKPNPLAPEFQKLWKSAGYSHALVPVFGGFTANSEFEALCGFPVIKNNVKFERQLLNSVPCLPNLLADKGYRTIASHPNVPVFWNRVNAYRNLGFQTYWSIKDFTLDDMNEGFLADSSLYQQVGDKLAALRDPEKPVLDYIVTYFGHWKYPLNENRPTKVSSASSIEEVTTYANTVYYKSRELMAFINDVRNRDPESILIIFGDHLPFLGENYAGYVDSGALAPKRSDFTPAMYKFYISTPLLVIDGKRGALKVGELSLYQIPKLVLDLLHYDELSIMDYTTTLPNQRVRPLPGLHINLLANGKVTAVCKQPAYEPECQESTQWLKDVMVVSNDLFIGRQFSRPIRELEQPDREAPFQPPGLLEVKFKQDSTAQQISQKQHTSKI